MADIVIRGMNAPKSCAECKVNCDMLMSGYLNGFAEGAYTRHPACPILALPEGHGRLVNADELKAKFFNTGDDYTGYEIHRVIEGAPTIVPAEIEGVE